MSVKNSTITKNLKFFCVAISIKLISWKVFFLNVCKTDITNKTTLLYVLGCNFNTNIKFIETCQIKTTNIFFVALKKNYFVRFFSFFLLVLFVLDHVTTRKDDFESTFKTHFSLQIHKGITQYVYHLINFLC